MAVLKTEEHPTESQSTPNAGAGVVPPGLKVIPTHRYDPRSDDEITSWLQKRHPVTSEKNIWAFWDSGFSNMPPWIQRNVISWIRRLSPDWTVHLLNGIPESETYAGHYIDDALLPKAFLNNTMDGKHKGTHQSDVIRLPLLYLYGGVWMDVGTMLFRHIDDICWKQIEDAESPYEIWGFHLRYVMVNTFIGCKSRNPFIKRWLDMFLGLWEDATNTIGFHRKELFAKLPHITSPSPELTAGDMIDYGAHVACINLVRDSVDEPSGWNGVEYYKKHMLLHDGEKEMALLQALTAWDGKLEFELLSRKRSGEGAVVDESWVAADELVKNVITNSALLKLSHGPKGMFRYTLAGFWDREENHDADVAPGTFAEYLRFASLHYEQSRVLEATAGEDLVKETPDYNAFQDKCGHDG